MQQNIPIATYKIIVVGICVCNTGNSNVGKTNILSQYTRNKFNPHIRNTVGIQFCSKMLYIQSNAIQLEIWDTAGQEKYRCMAPMFYKGAVGALVVFGLNDKNSFLDLPRWIKQIKQSASDDVKIILAGNKCDLNQKAVTIEQAQQFAKENNSLYIEMSAYQNLNIDAAFQHLVLQLYKNAKKDINKHIRKSNIKPIQIKQELQKAKKNKKQCC